MVRGGRQFSRPVGRAVSGRGGPGRGRGNGRTRGFHVAGFVVPMLSFREGEPAFTPNLGAYAGYSFHLADVIKVSLKLGAICMIDDVTQITDTGHFWPHVSFEVGYMF